MQTWISVLLGGSVLAFVQFLISRHDGKNEKKDLILQEVKGVRAEVGDIQKEVHQLREDVDEDRAITARVRILRFEDELQENRRHSKDSFDQCLSDITHYNKYCEHHPEFKNDQTAATVEHIRQVYKERLEKRDFL